MIQRIQSIYLLGAIVLLVLCFFYPIAELSIAEGDIFQFSMKGFYILHGDTKEIVQPLLSLTISGYLMVGLLVVILFLYKVRRMQMRLAIYSMVLLLGINFIFLYIIHNVKAELKATAYYHVTILFPFIGAILIYLAFRSIKKDEELVKSYDRLR
jgi:peptidoglycan/LPS O-acetylase OafA/YrhL